MDISINVCPERFDQRQEIQFQTTQQSLVDQTFTHNENYSGQYIDTVQPGRPLGTKFCSKVISTLIKIIIFTDTILTSLFPRCLSDFFVSADIEVAEHRNEESCFRNITEDNSVTHFVIIKSVRHTKHFLDRVHACDNVHSMYVQCSLSELKYQRRLARQYSKLDAVFDESLRLMIALIMDMALFCEETADRQRVEISSMEMVHKNYQRSIDLYGLAERLL